MASYEDIYETCKVRTLLSLSCRRCVYAGKECDKYCKNKKVDRPYTMNNTEEEKDGEETRNEE